MINIGSKQLKGISIGNRAVKEVYKGSQKIWAKESWINVSLTKKYFTISSSNHNTTEIISSALNVSDVTKTTFRISGSFTGAGVLYYYDSSGVEQSLVGAQSFNNLITYTTYKRIITVNYQGNTIKISINDSKQLTVTYWKNNDSYSAVSLTINKIELLS